MIFELLQQLSAERLGVIALGAFVGVLLALGLLSSGPTLKAVLTVIGAALGGAPVLFLSGTTEKWLYPIATNWILRWGRHLCTI